MAEYKADHAASITDPDTFWAAKARKHLTWWVSVGVGLCGWAGVWVGGVRRVNVGVRMWVCVCGCVYLWVEHLG